MKNKQFTPNKRSRPGSQGIKSDVFFTSPSRCFLDNFVKHQKEKREEDTLIKSYRRTLEKILLSPGVKDLISSGALRSLKALPSVPDNLNKLIESIESFQMEEVSTPQDSRINALKINLDTLLNQRQHLSKMLIDSNSKSKKRLTRSASKPNTVIRKSVRAKNPCLLDFQGVERVIKIANTLGTTAKNKLELLNEIRMNLQADSIVFFQYDPASKSWVGTLNDKEIKIKAKHSVISLVASKQSILRTKKGEADYDINIEEALKCKVSYMHFGPILDYTSTVQGVILLVYRNNEVSNRKQLPLLLDIFSLYAWKCSYEEKYLDKKQRLELSVKAINSIFDAKDYCHFQTCGESLTKSTIDAKRARLLYSDRQINKLYSKHEDDYVEYYPNQNGVAGCIANNQKPLIVNDVKNSAFRKEVDDPYNENTRNILGAAFGKHDMLADGVILAVNCLSGDFDDNSLKLIEDLAGILKNALDYMNIKANLKTLVGTFKSLKEFVNELDSDIESRARSFAFIQHQLDNFSSTFNLS